LEAVGIAMEGGAGGIFSAIVICLISTLFAVLVILVLASDLGQGIPYNPLAVLRSNAGAGANAAPEPASPKPDPNAEIEKALMPIRNAILHHSKTVDRINALISFNTIIGEYAKKVGGYPNSEGKVVSIRTVLTVLNASEFSAHVAPDIIDEMNYISDGVSYKAVNIGSGDCAVIRLIQPSMVDPKRSAAPLDCLAYGFWSPKGEAF